MAFWNRKRSEERTHTTGLASPQGWLNDALGGKPGPSGKRVTTETAMGIPSVWAAVSIISEQIGQLPLKVYRRLDSGDRVEARNHRSWALLHDKPNSSTPADRFWSTIAAHLLLHGNAFLRKHRDAATGVVDEIYILAPDQVTVAYNPETGAKQFVHNPSDSVRPKRIYDETEVLHIFGTSLDGVVGLSVIQTCRGTLGTAVARDEFEGVFYARGATLSGVLQHPNKLSLEAAQNLKDSFALVYGGSGKAHGTPVLEEGLEFVSVGSPLKDLQLVAAQNSTRTDIAVMFKLPPNYLGGSSGDGLTYATVESNQIQFALHAIAPWTNTIAKALSNDPGILPQNVFEAEFTLEAMMRGAANDRADFYQKMIAMGAMTADEVRHLENWPALTAAQKKDLAPAAVPPELPAPAVVNGDAKELLRLPVRAVN
ncbi:MAG: phage portal protein [Chloroflexi bacterium]|nr:phage portal protein [Chloroflexota bacterium]